MAETTTVHPLLAGLLAGERRAQKALWDMYAGRFLTLCKRYLGPTQQAEDVLMESMMTIFQRIDQYNGSGPLEAWMRRLVVNQALQALRQNRLLFVEVSEEETQAQMPHVEPSEMEAQELMALVARLPDGYRTVFNLYAIEGYGHQEIGQMLGISEGTSKSQLNRARALLQRWLSQEQVSLSKSNLS